MQKPHYQRSVEALSEAHKQKNPRQSDHGRGTAGLFLSFGQGQDTYAVNQ